MAAGFSSIRRARINFTLFFHSDRFSPWFCLHVNRALLFDFDNPHTGKIVLFTNQGNVASIAPFVISQGTDLDDRPAAV